MDDIYALIRDALAVASEGLHSAATVELAVNSVLRTVHQAVADFAQDWNEKSPCIAFSLPNELRIACLNHLEFSDRVTASHISRGWRKLLLAAPTLWNYVPSRARDGAFVSLFEAILSRTGSAPLIIERLSLGGTYGTRTRDERMWKLRDLLTKAMPCIESMSIALTTVDEDIIWNTPAPMLRKLSMVYTGCAQIPDSWWQLFAPRLRVLYLEETFSLPSSPDTSNNLEYFEASMCSLGDSGPELVVDARLLFVHFPHLKSLSLRHICDFSMLPNTQPPPCLRDVSLTAWTRDPDGLSGDIDSVLRLLRGAPLRSLCMKFFAQVTIDFALEFYLTCDASGPCHLDTNLWPDRIEIKGAVPNNTGLKFQITGPHLRTSTLLDSSCFRTLHSLSLYLDWILYFFAGGIRMPALVSLILFDIMTIDRSAIYHTLTSDDDTLHTLQLPALQQINFKLLDRWSPFNEQSTRNCIPDFIRTKLRYDTVPLRCIVLTTTQMGDMPINIDANGVLPLCSLAAEVYCEVEGLDGSRISISDHVAEAGAVSDDDFFQNITPLGA